MNSGSPTSRERIVLVTTSSVEQGVLVELERLGYDPVVEVLEKLSHGEIREIASRHNRGKIIIPGSAPGDYSSLGGRIVKGPYSIKVLPKVLRAFGIDSLDPALPAEKALGSSYLAVVREVLEELSQSINPVLGRVDIPETPPPLLVASEVYVDKYAGLYDALSEVLMRASLGADFVGLGTSSPVNPKLFSRIVEAAVEALGLRVALDPHDPSLVEGLSKDVEIDIFMSVVAGGRVPRRIGDISRYVVVLPNYQNNDLESRASAVLEACEWGLSQGFRPVVDPIMFRPGAPIGPLYSMASLRLARDLGMKCPALLGINNFYELIDADSHGVVAALTYLALESGASLILASEESSKARGSTLEARIASYMASYSLATGSPPKDIIINLLATKTGKYGSWHGCSIYRVLPRSWASFRDSSTTSIRSSAT
ncbi:MAG: hypothetical protein F7C09_01985 [Aeropyrum sp.]|nr:hypothetical protein [Aeropyrum sp.]